jgi:GntR family transcriptional regulator
VVQPSLFSRSSQPLYLQVAAIFRRNIQSGVWKPGERIPRLEVLGEQAGVSRITLRQAFGVLEDEGLIRRGRGSGTFVNETIPEVFRISLPKNWSETVALSRKLGTQSLVDSMDGVPLPEHLGMNCEFDRSGKFWFSRRLHEIDSTPVCFSEVYVSQGIYQSHAASFKTGTVAPVLDEVYGNSISHARQSVTIIEAGEESAESLRVPIATSVAELRRFACLEDKVIYFARLEFPTRFVQYEFDLLEGRKGV